MGAAQQRQRLFRLPGIQQQDGKIHQRFDEIGLEANGVEQSAMRITIMPEAGETITERIVDGSVVRHQGRGPAKGGDRFLVAGQFFQRLGAVEMQRPYPRPQPHRFIVVSQRFGEAAQLEQQDAAAAKRFDIEGPGGNGGVEARQRARLIAGLLQRMAATIESFGLHP